RRLISYFFQTPPQITRSLLNPDLAAQMGSPFAPLEQSLALIPSQSDPLNRMLFLDAKHFMADHNLNYGDKMSMAHGVEVRVPLLDRDLIKLAAGLAPGLKVKGSVGKWVLKQTM